VWHGGTRGEPELLASCYQHSIELAAANGIATLAIPSISTGIYGYPIEQAASIAVSTVRSSVQEFNLIQQVLFCCFSPRDLHVYEVLLSAGPA
jgi:O-acetyl-ADP-ribose deacetylase (regulator of RNase III)